MPPINSLSLPVNPDPKPEFHEINTGSPNRGKTRVSENKSVFCIQLTLPGLPTRTAQHPTLGISSSPTEKVLSRHVERGELAPGPLRPAKRTSNFAAQNGSHQCQQRHRFLTLHQTAGKSGHGCCRGSLFDEIISGYPNRSSRIASTHLGAQRRIGIPQRSFESAPNPAW